MSGRGVRFQTATGRAKALRQYEQLRRTAIVEKAIVICEMKDGSFHVLGQELFPHEMAPLLFVATDALTQVDRDRKIVRLEVHQEPEKRGVHNKSKPREKMIKTAPDGTLIPPRGENFVSCGECAHPTWHVLHRDDDDTTSRFACAHCGNEVAHLRVTHQEGGTA